VHYYDEELENVKIKRPLISSLNLRGRGKERKEFHELRKKPYLNNLYLSFCKEIEKVCFNFVININISYLSYKLNTHIPAHIGVVHFQKIYYTYVSLVII